MEAVKILVLFVFTAIAEILGCYLPYLWLRKSGSVWLLLPGALSLAAFSWLLSLHPTGAGRTYASYSGVYLASAVLWMWFIENQRPSLWDFIGMAVCLLGVFIMIAAPRG